MTIRRIGPPLDEPPKVFQEITDPELIARIRAQDAQARRNSDWLQAHWGDLLPQAYDKYVAVAGQEAFVADSAVEARARAVAAHPGDKGIIVMLASSFRGARIYAYRR